MDDPDRRALLRGLAASVVAGATTSIAGCAGRSFLDPGGGSSDASYLFEPGTVAEEDHYPVRFAATDVVSAYDDVLPDETVSDVENRAAWLYETTGLDFEDATAQLTFRTVAVVELPHDTEALEDRLEDEEFEEATDDELGYRIFRSEYGDRAVGSDGATLIGAEPTPEESDPEEVVEEVIETEAGEGDRYDEANEAFAAVADRLDGDVFLVRPHDETDYTHVERGLFENEVVRGLTSSLGEDATDVRVVLAFEDEEALVLDDVLAWTDTEAFDAWNGVSVDGAGAVVTVSGTVDTGAFELTVPRGGETAPLDWIPAPEALGVDRDFEIGRTAPQTLSEMDAVPDGFRESLVGGETTSILDLERPVLDRITAGPIEVLRTDRSEADLVDRLPSDVYERAGGRAGFTLYAESQDPGSVVAVDGGTLVYGRAWEDAEPTTVVTSVIDAVSGEAERYVDAYDPLAVVADRIEVTPATIYRPNSGSFVDGSQASGIEFEFGSERTRLTLPYVFEDVVAADSNELERRYGEQLEDFEIREVGRVVVVTGTVATDELG